jgi:hypothetical protein
MNFAIRQSHPAAPGDGYMPEVSLTGSFFVANLVNGADADSKMITIRQCSLFFRVSLPGGKRSCPHRAALPGHGGAPGNEVSA